MEVHILPHRVRIFSIPLGKIERYSHALLQRLPVDAEGGSYGLERRCEQGRFYGVTRTDEEFSVIMDTETFGLYDNLCGEEDVDLWPDAWSLIEALWTGGNVPEKSEIVQKFAKPLAEAQISIFYYCTYHADFIFVQSHNLGRAVRCLRDAGASIVEQSSQGFSYREEFLSGPAFATDDQNENASPTPCSSELSNPEAPPHRTPKLRLSKNDLQLTVGSLPLERLCNSSVFSSLIQLLFFNLSSSFFSFSVVDSRVSVIMHSEQDDAHGGEPARHCMNQIRPVCEHAFMNFMESNWISIKVDEGPLGFEKCGIVNDLTTSLAGKGIPIYYISTVETDFILIDDRYAKEATKALLF
eukprot:Nk52_evm23s223 gene=Nk52_evmTU23s223